MSARDRLVYFADHTRELSNRLGKCAVVVEVDDHDLRLPREGWSPFWASFIHVVRNAVDHGLETEAERALSRKSSPAHIRLGAERQGEFIVIELSDDGRGVNWEAIALRAREAGLPADGKDDWIQALFAGGLSAKAAVTEMSGRGVGLGAARAACEALGGHATVESDTGHGATFRFFLPAQTSAPNGAFVQAPSLAPAAAASHRELPRERAT